MRSPAVRFSPTSSSVTCSARDDVNTPRRGRACPGSLPAWGGGRRWTVRPRPQATRTFLRALRAEATSSACVCDAVRLRGRRMFEKHVIHFGSIVFERGRRPPPIHASACSFLSRRRAGMAVCGWKKFVYKERKSRCTFHPSGDVHNGGKYIRCGAVMAA